MVSFANHLNDIPEDIAKRYVDLKKNSDFVTFTTSATTDVDVLKKRFEIADQTLFGDGRR